MSSDLNAILVGYRGKIDMLKQCFGSSDDPPEKPKKPPSAAEIKAFARAHNAARGKRKG